MSRIEKCLLCASLLVSFVITVFSYSYVDLNLTLTNNQLALNTINTLQRIGYYNRPLATQIYLLLIVVSFFLFITNLFLASHNKLSKKYVYVTIMLNTLILLFAYPFLSSDIFNYIFDARIVTHYHLNPYTHKALDFQTDDWIRFMRWTHRYSPYGPVWILISIFPSLLGLNKFVLNLLLFKMLVALFYLLNAYLVLKISKSIFISNSLFPIVFYALNPLFLIEGIVNGHNDVLVTTFLLLSALFFIKKHSNKTLTVLLIGGLVKYVPLLAIPNVLFLKIIKKTDIKRYLTFNLIIILLFTLMVSTIKLPIPFFSSSTQIQFQPWYLFWSLPLAVFLPEVDIFLFAIGISFGSLLRYLPYLLYGDWTQPGTIQYMTAIVFLTIMMSILIGRLNYQAIKKRLAQMST